MKANRSKRFLMSGLAALLPLFGLVLAGCPTPAVDEPFFVEVTGLTSVRPFVSVGPYSLQGKVVPENAVGQSIVWSVKDAGMTGATINGNTLSTTRVGKVTVTATVADGKALGTPYTKDFDITIGNYTEVSGVSLDMTSLPLNAGEEEILTPTVEPKEASYKGVSWASSAPGVATVDANGTVTARAVGTATITVTTEDGGKTAGCNVTVYAFGATKPPQGGVSLNKTSLTLKVGEGEILTANRAVSWKSTAPGVATVDANGTVIARTSGAAIIAAAGDGGKIAFCTVTVEYPTPVTGVSLNKTSLTLAMGRTAELTATVAPTDATMQAVTWASSAPAVATVEGGTVTALSPGAAIITAITADGGKSATCTVTVEYPTPVTGVSLNKTSLALAVDHTEALTATVAPANASNKDVIWTSDDTGVATVDANGTVTAVAEGEATITVTTEDGGKTAECEVTVTQPVTGVSLNKTSLALEAGDTETLTAEVAPTDATNKTVTWTSDDNAIAMVDANGTVTARAHGTTTITVTTEDGGKTAECAVTVARFVRGVIINKTDILLEAGDTETLAAEVTPVDATNKTVTWTSTDPAVATVNANGMVTTVAGAGGQATITVEADGGHTASCTVRVLPHGEMVSLKGGTVVGSKAYAPGGGGYDTQMGVFYEGRTITLSPFSIAKHETTYELWKAVYDWATDPARGRNKYTIARPGRQGVDTNPYPYISPAGSTNKHPVTEISWRDAVVWCNAYSEMTGRDPVYYAADGSLLRVSTDLYVKDAVATAVPHMEKNGYRLPTEAEWEYAARGGDPSAAAFKYRWAGTNDESKVGDYAWIPSNSDEQTHPVGQKLPNTAGLYDMTGNVREYCWDWYHDVPYDIYNGAWKGTHDVDPLGAEQPRYPDRYNGFSAPERIERGWDINNLYPLYHRMYIDLNSAGTIGFRVVRRPYPTE